LQFGDGIGVEMEENKTIEINIRVSLKRFSIGDLLRFSQNDSDAVIHVVASCMVDPATGEYYKPSEQGLAREILTENISVEQFDGIVTDVMKKIMEVRTGTVPPA
jgi:hypothetical protein